VAPDLAQRDPALCRTAHDFKKSNRPGGFAGLRFYRDWNPSIRDEHPYGGGKVTDSAKTQNDVPVETSISTGEASLESILCTEELNCRPSRPPDYEKENRALVALMSALDDSPSTIFQTLADTILDITQCDSAGLSLLTRDGKKPDVCGKRFYWPAIAGMWNPHVGGGTPRNFGPCGDVLDQNRALLFRHFERRYPYLLPVNPAAEECLLVPFYVGGEAVGTIWGIMHSDRRKFDAEDDRVMGSLGKFASSAYQTVTAIDDLKFQVAERQKAEAAVRELAKGLEVRIRRLVDANIIGIFIWDLDGKIVEANDAFLHIVEYDREDLVWGRMRWTDLTPREWRERDEHAVADLRANGSAQPYEKEYIRKDGSRVPVLVGAALFEEGGNAGVAFVLDLREQKRAEEVRERLRQAQAELAHMTRVMTIGQVAASIAHEVNQPLSGIVTNASTCLRMLEADPPNLEGARETARRTIRDGSRASEVITRLRALFSKKSAAFESFDLNEAAKEVIALSVSELQRNRVIPQLDLAAGLPPVLGDRIQIQQVILNLIRNGSDAMSAVEDRPRELLIKTESDEGGGVRLSVRDTGLGIDSKVEEKLFEAFYSTKSDGMGIGLCVSRSIMESHRGRLWAMRNEGPGATFLFSIPCRINI
jgi:PAS domain S-box-containing protein